MKITCRDRTVETSYTGCQCHELAMQFGELIEGCCRECGCPKTVKAFNRFKGRPLPFLGSLWPTKR